MKSATFFALCLVVAPVVLAVTSPAKNCVLNDRGEEDCGTPSTALSATFRQAAPCSKMDMECWCMKAKDYTNDVRRRNGMSKMLKVGTMKQLNNAVRYAGVLGDKGFLEHQELSDATAEIGCGRFIGGENIAYNYEQNDIAKACVDQWEGSSGHLENILRDWFEEVVVGFHFESDGRVYCVQTFAQKNNFGSGSESDARCELVDDNGSGPTPTKPAPTKPAPTKPAPTEPAPTRPAPTKPMPTRPGMTKKMKDEGNRSCRCIELGKKCWSSLRRLSGNRCMPFVSPRNQPKKCKTKCCNYCKFYPNAPPCRARRTKSICNSL